VSNRKLALITGASSGIGREFARFLAKSGYDIIAVARRRELLESLASELQVFCAQTKVVVADLSTSVGVQSVIDEASSVDFLVLNAGITRAARVGSTSGDEITKLNTLLATGVVEVCEAIVPKMMHRRVYTDAKVSALRRSKELCDLLRSKFEYGGSQIRSAGLRRLPRLCAN
jgi:uncharacterized protein